MNAKCGLVTTVQDPTALAGAIRALANDRSLCADFGARSRNYLVDHFSREVVVKRYLNVILDHLVSR